MPRHQRTTAATEQITVARLDRPAHRLLDVHAPDEQLVAELHQITRDPRLLAQAGGAELGAWKADQTKAHRGRDIARVMVLAGADEELVQRVAGDLHARMSHRNARGS